MFKKIAVAFDESAEAERAFRRALELAKFAAAELCLITVIEAFPAYFGYVSAAAPDVTRVLVDERRSFYEDLQKRARLHAAEAGVTISTELAEGSEVATIVRAVERVNPDVLVVGLHHHATDARIFGGTAHQLAVQIKCDILGVH
jgi:nucleotide-binding universal stress UspA family protein